MPRSIIIFNDAVHQYLHTDFVVEHLKGDCLFSEGPVYNKEGFYLFSDIPANVIYKIDRTKMASVYLQQTGWTPGNTRALSEQIGSNGLAYDAAGNLFICQHGNGAIAKYDGTFLKPHITEYNGKPFNSPNDIVVDKNGSIFFSDPPYGLKDSKLVPDTYQEHASFYCWQHGVLKMFCDRYQYPNGVCLSPDGQTVYTCSNKPFEAFVLAYDATTLVFKKMVAAENGDGIKCDRHGNLFLCTKEGVLVINEKGERLALIQLDTIPANCCWGGAGGNDLLITARQNIYLIPGLQKA